MISFVITLLIMAIILYALYWVIVVKLAPEFGEPIAKFIRIAFWVIVALLLIGFLTNQVPIPKFG